MPLNPKISYVYLQEPALVYQRLRSDDNALTIMPPGVVKRSFAYEDLTQIAILPEVKATYWLFMTETIFNGPLRNVANFLVGLLRELLRE